MVQDLSIILQYIILGALAGIIYGLRRIYTVERQLAELELKIDAILEHHKIKKRRR